MDDNWRPKDLSQDYETKSKYVMTLAQWCDLDVLITDIPINPSPKDGSSTYKNSTIGVTCRWFPMLKSMREKGDLFYYAVADDTKKTLCLMDFTLGTDKKLLDHYKSNGIKNRNDIYNTIKDKDFIKRVSNLTVDEIYKAYKDASFVLSPLGNGFDCHRNVEALLSKCIPIIPSGCKEIHYKYRNMPIIFTDDFGSITEEWLKAEREKMMNKYYDFSLLFINSYEEKTREIMKGQSQHWIKDQTGKDYNW